MERVNLKDKYDYKYFMIYQSLSALAEFIGAYRDYSGVIKESSGTVRSADDPIGRSAVRKIDGTGIKNVSELEDFDKTKAALIKITMETA